MKVDILFEDEFIVVLNKEAGVLTVADRFNFESLHLQSFLRNKYGEIFTIHRLDRDTSGVICFAKDAESHKNLSAQFEGREVEKHYKAIVEGIPPDHGIIDEALAESQTKRGVMKVYKKGKPSVTEYWLSKSYTRCSLLDVQIYTGRMHQIRVHLAYIGFPLFVDPVYGRRESFLLSEIKGKKYRSGKYSDEERPLISRQTLHSSKLVFNHPFTNARMTIEAPMPKDMTAMLKQMEKLEK